MTLIHIQKRILSLPSKLLSETLLGIDEIALQCGYHYPANFIRMFKKYYGVTPLQFRKFITR